MLSSLTRCSRRPRRSLALVAALGLALPLTVSAPSSADDAGTFTVVGTSDVFDSHLVQDVLEPGFEAAYPQYDLQYVSKGTGAAIAYAEAGTASALLVHAAALENQFVADGYSLEKYGRAIFWGDYVLLGPADDPAGVLQGDSTEDIRHAFEKVAAAGEAGTANFVSRGGTPGTTVQEHAIWSETTGVQTCAVSAANGGGASPSTDTGDCASPIALPSWYHATGLTQGPNIINGDACNYDGGGCYVFTDRGTFQYLQATGAVSNLQIVTRPDKGGDPALSNLLVNSFHAYGINPGRFSDPDVQINEPAARAFLSWITSPAAQQQIGAYLETATAGDPPFLPSAAPAITVTSQAPHKVSPGKKVVVKGTVTNEVPGTPPLAGKKVRLLSRPSSAPGASPTQVAKGKTDASGHFRLTYKPTTNLSYQVAVPGYTQIENSQLDPIFGDLLQPNSADAGATLVKSKLSKVHGTGTGHGLHVTGRLSPAVSGRDASLVLYAGHPGKPLKKRGSTSLADGSKSFDKTFSLGSGVWRWQVRYLNPRVVLTGHSGTQRVTVP